MNNNFVIYAAYYNDELMYIGRGGINRPDHINSGCSHVYEANKLHFSGGLLNVKLLHENITEQESKKIEKLEIIDKNPKWNISNTNKNTMKIKYDESVVIRKCVKNMLESAKTSKIYRYNKEVIDLIKRICYIQNNNSFMPINMCRDFNIAGKFLAYAIHISPNVNKSKASMPKYISEIFMVQRKFVSIRNKEVWCVLFNKDALLKYYIEDDSSNVEL